MNVLELNETSQLVLFYANVNKEKISKLIKHHNVEMHKSSCKTVHCSELKKVTHFNETGHRKPLHLPDPDKQEADEFTNK